MTRIREFRIVPSGIFEWDDAKVAANLIKHGVRFEITADVLLDEALRDIDVSRVTDAEARRKAVGIHGRVYDASRCHLDHLGAPIQCEGAQSVCVALFLIRRTRLD